jgi:hypothetical protein
LKEERGGRENVDRLQPYRTLKLKVEVAEAARRILALPKRVGIVINRVARAVRSSSSISFLLTLFGRRRRGTHVQVVCEGVDVGSRQRRGEQPDVFDYFIENDNMKNRKKKCQRSFKV